MKWNIKQCQSPWGSMKLGNSQETCCKSGCVTTGLSALSDWYGEYVNPAKAIPKLKYTDAGLIIWSSVDDVFPCKFVWRYYPRQITKEKILQILQSKDNAALLQVWYGRHWVVLTGFSRWKGYRVFDPLHGDIIWLADRYKGSQSVVEGMAEFTRK